MAIDAGKNIIDAVILATSATTIYTVTNNLLRAKIDSIAFTNYGSAIVKLTVHIVSSGGTASSENMLIKEREIKPGKTYLAPELNGQGISEGGTIQAFSDIATSVGCTATGTLYS